MGQTLPPHQYPHTLHTHTHTYTGRPPFNGANHIQLLANIERQEPHLPDSLPAHLSPACRHLISRLLRRLPEHRMGFDEFFTHAFFQGGLSPDVSRGGEWGGDPGVWTLWGAQPRRECRGGGERGGEGRTLECGPLRDAFFFTQGSFVCHTNVGRPKFAWADDDDKSPNRSPPACRYCTPNYFPSSPGSSGAHHLS